METIMKLLLQLFAVIFLLLLSTLHTRAEEGPQWIWGAGSRDGEKSVALQTTFEVPADTRQVKLWVANAYCDCEVVSTASQ